MPKEKPTPLLGRKNYSIDVTVCHLFYRKSSFSLYYLFPTSVNTRQFRSLVAVLKRK